MTKTEDALGRVTETKWVLSDKVEETDALGRKVRYRYNKKGCLTAVRLPTGGYYQYRYNKLGQVIEVLNPQGEK